MYQQITDLHFAVWNMIKPINFIWVDVANGCVKCGVKDEPTDTVIDQREFDKQQQEALVELIAYDDKASPYSALTSLYASRRIPIRPIRRPIPSCWPSSAIWRR